MFDKYSKAAGKEQYLIPYFIAAHPGTRDQTCWSWRCAEEERLSRRSGAGIPAPPWHRHRRCITRQESAQALYLRASEK